MSRHGTATPPAAAGPGGAGAGVLSMDAAGALGALGSSRRGLDASEAARRLAAAGPNRLPRPRRRPVAAELAAQLANMFAVVLLVAAGLTFGIYFLSAPRDTSNLYLAFGITAVVVLNALIGFVQEHAAERTAEALQAMVPHQARVLRGGELAETPAEDLVPGDLLVLEAGDAVPADARVIEAHALSVELAALTGESQPSGRTTEPAGAGTAAAEARDGVFMGTSVTAGTGKAVVYATGLGTEFGRIYRLTAGLPPEPSPLQRQVADMARRVAAVAIGTGTLLFALRVVTGNPAALSFVFALGVMVALVPEGLPATLSVSLAIGVRRMARRHALIKKLAAVEALGSTTVICTDKTGTLTKAEMTVQQVYASGRVHKVTGTGYAPEGEVEDAAVVADVLRAGALCSDARLLAPSGGQGWHVLGDTTEGAILVAAAKAGIDLPAEAARTPRVGAFPFDPGRKLMTTVHRVDGGFEAYMKGSPQAVLERCADACWDGRTMPLDDGLRALIGEANDAMAGQALRVLAVARKAVASPRVSQDEAEHGLTFLGLAGMSDPPRPEVTAAVAACRRAGITIYMVTGDYGLTAEAIARRVGITGEGPARVVSGADLDTMDDEALAGMLRAGSQVIFARVRPEHKLRVVATLEKLGEVVAVTGDGANDAPALKRASIGVSMGADGTDVARSASVMVLLDDSFASIAAAVELGRAVYANIRRFLVYLFSHNLAELAPILAATFTGFPLVPLSALQVLSIDLGSDVLPALALGAERPEPGTMDRPPRPPAEHLFNWPVVRRFLFLGTIQSAGVVFAFFWRIHTAHLPFHAFTAANPVYREAVTMTQAGIVVSQFFNSFAVRTDRESVFRAGLLSNRPLIAAGCFGLGFMAAVSYVPALQAVFNTAPLTLPDWLMLTAFGVLLLAADEARKAWHRRADRSRRREPGHTGRAQRAVPAAPQAATGGREQ
ncbi:MAG TPA: cation-transporting P-type ATPase [Streptosporangiaceae bacterium]|nr:cation-transporting P-type ATPase [Streptosporangiaceae bacterium]